jgi:hypothetical protein
MMLLAVALAPRRLPYDVGGIALLSVAKTPKYPSESPRRKPLCPMTLAGGSLPCGQSTSPEALLRCEVVGHWPQRSGDLVPLPDVCAASALVRPLVHERS